MGNWSLGSVSDQVHNFVEGVPSSVSGTPMLALADRKRQFVENYIDVAIGSNSIGISHQSIILNLTIAETLRSMNLIGADVSSISLGDLSISKGGESNLEVSAVAFEKRAMEELKVIGWGARYYKALG